MKLVCGLLLIANTEQPPFSFPLPIRKGGPHSTLHYAFFGGLCADQSFKRDWFRRIQWRVGLGEDSTARWLFFLVSCGPRAKCQEPLAFLDMLLHACTTSLAESSPTLVTAGINSFSKHSAHLHICTAFFDSFTQSWRWCTFCPPPPLSCWRWRDEWCGRRAGLGGARSVMGCCVYGEGFGGLTLL